MSMFRKISQREREVLNLIAFEYNLNEIAAALYISTNTVKTHKRHLQEKLGAKNIAGLVRRAYETGIMRIPSAA